MNWRTESKGNSTSLVIMDETFNNTPNLLYYILHKYGLCDSRIICDTSSSSKRKGGFDKEDVGSRRVKGFGLWTPVG